MCTELLRKIYITLFISYLNQCAPQTNVLLNYHKTAKIDLGESRNEYRDIQSTSVRNASALVAATASYALKAGDWSSEDAF